MENNDLIEVNDEVKHKLINILSRYVNFKKVLHNIDKGICDEFYKKQNYYYKITIENNKCKESTNHNHSTGTCGDSIINNKSK